MSPGVRYDPFAEGSQTPDIRSERRTHAAVMRETQVLNEKRELELKIKEKAKAGELKVVSSSSTTAEKKKRRWDQVNGSENNETPSKKSSEDEAKWHEAETPRNLPTSLKDMETPMHRAVWEATPGHADSGAITPPDLSVSETPKVKSGMYFRKISKKL